MATQLGGDLLQFFVRGQMIAKAKPTFSSVKVLLVWEGQGYHSPCFELKSSKCKDEGTAKWLMLGYL